VGTAVAAARWDCNHRCRRVVVAAAGVGTAVAAADRNLAAAASEHFAATTCHHGAILSGQAPRSLCSAAECLAKRPISHLIFIMAA